jgi:hypothetical protein
MKKIKLFLEFVSGNKESMFIPLTYDDISKRLGCTIDEVEEFENWLDENIKPGEIFHGSLSSTDNEEEHEKPVDIFDKIEDEEDYMEMWNQYKSTRTGHSSHSHDEDGL